MSAITAAIIDYGSGNLRSAAKAFERALRDSGLRGSVVVTADPAFLSGATHIVLPGVGAFADCRAGLDSLPGMVVALTREVRENKKPFLGICVGMQLMAERGHEYGTHSGLGWIPGEVCALAPSDRGLKIPHMGWNELLDLRPHPVLDGIGAGSHCYFVHSYGFVASAPQDVLARTDYGGPVAAVVGRENMVGTQFHPEKSQATGLRFIANFLRWEGRAAA